MKRYDSWVTPFLSLDLRGGTLVTISNNDEDMLEIKWHDGMWIDVGFIKDENVYYITAVASDAPESWNHPISVTKITERHELVAAIQAEILRCRA